MERTAAAFIFVVGAAFLLTACQMGPDMKEGKWEINTEMGLKGIPIKLPAMASTLCLTQKNPIPQEQLPERDCVVTEKKTNDDTVTWKMVCKDNGTEVISEGMITYSGVLFSGKIDTTISGGPMAMTASNTITGKYLGPCGQ